MSDLQKTIESYLTPKERANLALFLKNSGGVYHEAAIAQLVAYGLRSQGYVTTT